MAATFLVACVKSISQVSYEENAPLLTLAVIEVPFPDPTPTTVWTAVVLDCMRPLMATAVPGIPAVTDELTVEPLEAIGIIARVAVAIAGTLASVFEPCLCCSPIHDSEDCRDNEGATQRFSDSEDGLTDISAVNGDDRGNRRSGRPFGRTSRLNADKACKCNKRKERKEMHVYFERKDVRG